MDYKTGRPNHIEDALVKIHTQQWFRWTDSKNKVYTNLRLTEKIGVKGVMENNPVTELPSESVVNAKLKELQDNFDEKNKEYKLKRALEYPSVQDLVVALYDTDDKAAIEAKRAEVKAKYPKS
tara:strand:- start:805 stop:1173 length:369 start_codon:yes stop_codon:yes gene_type:complete